MSLATRLRSILRQAPSVAARHLALGAPVVLALAFYAADTWVSREDTSLGLPFAGARAASERPIPPEALRVRFPDDSTALVAGEAVRVHPSVRSFYAGRAFEAVWADAAARDTLVAALLAVEDEGIRPAEVGADRLAARLRRGIEGDSARVDLDLLLTDGYFRLADVLLGRRVDPEALYRRVWFPARRRAIPAVLLREAVASDAPGVSVAAALSRLRPPHPEYAALRAALARVRRDDGTPRLPVGRTIGPGDTSALVPLLRARLGRTGDYSAPPRPDSLARIYEAALADALGRFQSRRGLEPTGVLDGPTREALNTPASALAPLLALNLERWRWLPDTLGPRHVWVNLPTYELALRVRDGAGWREERTMSVVVGGSGRWKTPVFSDTIAQVVFNPTWSIPASIQMESYGYVNPRGVVRGPGPGNPLGRVKFVFPNPHGIYLHDTNARSAFGREVRALSHGCIRLRDPRGLADAVLAPEGWDTTRVASRFRGPWRTEPVDLTGPLPVHLVYFTAAPAPDGTIRFHDDVYRYDARLAEALGYTAAELEAALAAR